jgi:hypothetical protein
LQAFTKAGNESVAVIFQATQRSVSVRPSTGPAATFDIAAFRKYSHASLIAFGFVRSPRAIVYTVAIAILKSRAKLAL